MLSTGHVACIHGLHIHVGDVDATASAGMVRKRVVSLDPKEEFGKCLMRNR